jgi:hypothetical protein
MSWIVTIAGWAQILASIFMVMVARSAMHETTAVVAFGSGILAIGLGRLLQYREDDDKRRPK